MQLDLPTGEGMQQCFEHLGPVDIVINCAAISSPAACEKEEQAARSAFPASPVCYCITLISIWILHGLHLGNRLLS